MDVERVEARAVKSDCIACGSAKVASIWAYKNTWRACRVCGTIARQRKDRYLASRVPGLDRIVRGAGMRNILFGEDVSRERESAAYDGYNEICTRGVVGSKWEKEHDNLESELGAFGFTLKVPRLLDVSGGPGFLAQALKEQGVDTVVTEFSPQAVEAIEKVLGVRAVVFDDSWHDLPDVLPDGKSTFEALLVRYSLNFCQDVPRFARGAARVVEKDGLLYMSYARPTLGCIVHWDLVEYTYNALYPSTYVRSVFEQEGFQFVGEVPSEHKGYDWTRGFDWRLKAFVLPTLTLGLANVNLRRFQYPFDDTIATLRTVTCEEIYRRR